MMNIQSQFYRSTIFMIDILSYPDANLVKLLIFEKISILCYIIYNLISNQQYEKIFRFS